VTDHGPTNEQKAGPFLELEVGEALSESPVQQKVATTMAVSSLPAVGFGICTPFSASSSTQPSKERPHRPNGALYVAVHPDGASQGGLPALFRLTGTPARDCVPTAD
jgi:hypothetical protein